MAIGNSFMDMISKGISNTKPEGVMTARNERIMQLDSLIDPDMDPGDLRTIYDDMMRESGGSYPGVDFDTFLKSIGTRTASNDEAVRQLETLFEMFKDQGMSDEEAEKAARERMESASVRKAADGGIVSLADGGDPEDVPLKKTIKTPSTYGKRVFEDFLFDAGFVKIDPDTKKPRGSKGDFNKYLLNKGIKPGSEAGTAELNKILKKLNKPMYISLEMAQGGKGLSLAEEATGTKKGREGAAARNDVFKGVDEIRTKANKMDFKNKEEKYNFIKKEIKKKFPAIAAGTLATLAKGTALGMGLEMFMPQELQAATLYSPEDMDKMLGEMAIREKFE